MQVKEKTTFILILAFLLVDEIKVQARDLRPRDRNEVYGIQPNIISPKPTDRSENNTDVINIVDTNGNGVSHNKFQDFNVGDENGVIFNNSMVDGTSVIGGKIQKNNNLTNNAKIILNEVKGNQGSNINGDIEIFGVRADFILANENGIYTKDAIIINSSGTTLTTGKVFIDERNMHFDVQKGNVNLNGLTTSGDYFNVLAKTVQVQKEISPLKGEKNPNLTFIAGENELSSDLNNLNDIRIDSSKNAEGERYGIYASSLGAMYGRNIRLISTDKGVGVIHNGLIMSEEDMTIDAQGNILLTSVVSQRDLNVKGKSLATDGKAIKSESDLIKMISAEKDINFDISDNVVLESAIQSLNGNITIVAKNLTLKDKTSAKIVSAKDIKVNLSEKFNVQGVMVPTIPGKTGLNLVIVMNENGELEAKDLNTQKIYKATEITWVSTGIFGSDVKIFAKEVENRGVISANKKLEIKAEEIKNKESSVIEGTNIDIDAKKSLVNSGEIRENKKGTNEFVDEKGILKIKVSLGGFENYGNITAKEIEALAQSLINSLDGKIIATDGNIILTTTIGDLINNGTVLTSKNKDINLISSSSIKNTGKIGSNNILVQALNGHFFNAGEVAAIKELEIIVDALINSGNAKEIEKNLKLLYEYSNENLKKAQEISESLKDKIEKETDLDKKDALKETLRYFDSIKENLSSLGEKLQKTGDLGLLYGDKINITANKDIKNQGLITANKNINIIGNTITNDGFIESDKDILLRASESILNSRKLTAGDTINVDTKSFKSAGNKNSISNYIKLLQSFDKDKFNSLQRDKINIENELVLETDISKISTLKKQLLELKVELKKLEDIKNEIGLVQDLGIIESKSLFVTTVRNLENNGIVLTKENAKLSSEATILNAGKIQVDERLDINSKNLENSGNVLASDLNVNLKEELKNTGRIQSKKDIKLSANSIVNKDDSTIWAGNNLSLNALKNIYNGLRANISSEGNANLKAEAIYNNAGTINAEKDMTITTDLLENKSVIDGSVSLNDIKIVDLEQINGIFSRDYFINLEIPEINNNLLVKDKAIINSGGNLVIKEFSNKQNSIINEGGVISAATNMDIKGDITNKSLYQEVDIMWFLDNTNITLSSKWGGRYSPFNGSLKDALTKGVFKDEDYYNVLKTINNPVLNQVLSVIFGSEWKAKKSIKLIEMDLSGTVLFYAAKGESQILSGGKLNHSLGSFNNDGGFNKNLESRKVKIGEEIISVMKENMGADIRNINTITEFGKVKQLHKSNIAIDEVEINGKTIKAETGNLAGSIAVAGTINPIVFINIPTGDNGIFKITTPKPGFIQPLIETNIDFINPKDYVGAEYFFDKIGDMKEKSFVLIGDAYYEQKMLSNMLRETLGYTQELKTEDIKELLDNAFMIEQSLGYEIGKPLTTEQINELSRDIIWYVEIEIEGTKVLSPQIYFSKESRINIAENQGNGGMAIVKANQFEANSTSFNNNNGNIIIKEEVKIKSEEDIKNNSFGGTNSGITSINNKVEIKTDGKFENKGGSVTGKQVDLSANNGILVESTSKVNENGDQIISDKATIKGNESINILSKKDIDLKGAIVTTNKENDGQININADNKVNIEDIYTISSKYVDETKNSSNYDRSSSAFGKSNGSKIEGTEVNINSKSDVNLKGSHIEAKGDINIKTEGNLNILDTKYLKEESREVNQGGFLGYTNTKTEKTSSLSKGSEVKSNSGKINLISDKNIEMINADLNSAEKGTIHAKNNVTIKAGKSESTENTQTTTLGWFGNAEVGVAGLGVSTRAKQFGESIMKEINEWDESKEDKLTLSDSEFAKYEGGFEVNYTTEEKKNIKYSSSKIKGSGLDIIAENTLDIGGGDFDAKDNKAKFQGKTVKTTKYEDIEETNTKELGVYAKGKMTGGSSLLGVVNTVADVGLDLKNAKTGEDTIHVVTDNILEVTDAINNIETAALIYADFEGGLGVSHKKQNKKDTKENITHIKGNQVEIIALDGNLDLIGVDIKSKTSTYLEAKENLNIESAKNTSVENINDQSYYIGAGVSLSEKGVIPTLAGDIKYEHSDSISKDIVKSTIKSDGETTFKSGKDINLKSISVDSDTGVEFNAGKNLNIETLKSTKETNEHKIKIDGKAGNGEKVTGKINVKYEQNSENLQSIDKSDIKSAGKINVKSEENTYLKGVEINSETEVEFNVGKDLHVGSVKTENSKQTINTGISLGYLSKTTPSEGSDGSSTNEKTISGAINFEYGKTQNNGYEGSEVISGGKMTINTEGDTNIKSSTITAKSLDLNIKENLNIESEKEELKEEAFHFELSGSKNYSKKVNPSEPSVSEPSISEPSVSKIQKEGIKGSIKLKKDETLKKASINVTNGIKGTVDGDVNLKGAEITSEKKANELNVEGKTTLETVELESHDIDIMGGSQTGGAYIEKMRTGFVNIFFQKEKKESNID